MHIYVYSALTLQIHIKADIKISNSILLYSVKYALDIISSLKMSCLS
jgi:hypothetical protein